MKGGHNLSHRWLIEQIYGDDLEVALGILDLMQTHRTTPVSIELGCSCDWDKEAARCIGILWMHTVEHALI